ncbi:MAG: ATP-dependent helicase, partial [Trichococcus flocculiformis]
ISFCDETEASLLRDIEKLIKRKVPVVTDQPFLLKEGTKAAAPQPKKPIAARNNGTRVKNQQGPRGGQKAAQRPRFQTKQNTQSK